MASPSYPHVLIVGGGLGGLTLAQALRKQGISFEIFERDPDADARPQGWAIGLHTMLDDLLASFPGDMPPMEVVNHLVPLDLPAQFIFYDSSKPGARFGVQDGMEGGNKLLRANRHRLRDWLRTNIPVQYGKKATRIEQAEDKVTVHFGDGTRATGDILVGAEGIHSVAREHLLGDKKCRLKKLPIGILVGEVELSGDDMIRQLELAHSAYVTWGKVPSDQQQTVMMFAGLNEVHPDGKSGKYYWLVGWNDDEAASENKPYWTITATQEQMMAIAREKAQQVFDPVFQEIIEKTPVTGMKCPPLIFRDLELEREDIPAGRVTLLGDAAHCMTPFRGEGGVCAMGDSLDLARAIGRLSRGEDTLEHAMASYRDIMLERGVKAVRASRQAFAARRVPEMDNSTSGPRLAWGSPACAIPKEVITL
ncbi:hypothetical protein QBC46DRAFT_382699 [Diplogelasinospora grovesii]|uniref:FAD-binding domain-containing protein n=1 Tax=Diplogelasinospora grovesii TaxID=303347 RepID=A0AAN6NAZ3_9PEZI|nr:hypothetical protein QBC46DRAFT_382699 [Diplogelasinospora grovesii]